MAALNGQLQLYLCPEMLEACLDNSLSHLNRWFFFIFIFLDFHNSLCRPGRPRTREICPPSAEFKGMRHHAQWLCRLITLHWTSVAELLESMYTFETLFLTKVSIVHLWEVPDLMGPALHIPQSKKVQPVHTTQEKQHLLFLESDSSRGKESLFIVLLC